MPRAQGAHAYYFRKTRAWTRGKNVAWKEIKVDTACRFTGRKASNGYIYLTWNSSKEQGALINNTGNSMFYLNGEPHAGDPYDHKWLNIPVRLKKGLNEIYVRNSLLIKSTKYNFLIINNVVFINN